MRAMRQAVASGGFNSIIEVAQAVKRREKRFRRHGCQEVILIGEFQGGHVAARLASIVKPHLLALIASLPDEPDIARLRDAGTQVVVGWKVSISARTGIGNQEGS